MDIKQMQKIVDNAPEWAKYVRNTPGMTHYSESHLVGSTSIDKLRTELAKQDTLDLEPADIPHGCIVLEK